MPLVDALPASARRLLTRDEELVTELFRRNTPSVVYITNLAIRCGDWLPPSKNASLYQEKGLPAATTLHAIGHLCWLTALKLL